MSLLIKFSVCFKCCLPNACCLLPDAMRCDTIFIIRFHLMHTYLPYITWLWLHHHIRRRWHKGLARENERQSEICISFHFIYEFVCGFFSRFSLRIDTHIYLSTTSCVIHFPVFTLGIANHVSSRRCGRRRKVKCILIQHLSALNICSEKDLIKVIAH